jgi:hypothetical protein
MKRLFIFCGNGYQFIDFYYPIIKEVYNSSHIVLIFSNSFLYSDLTKKIEQFKIDGIIETYFIVNFYNEKSIYLRFKEVIEFLDKLKFSNQDIVIWPEEFIEISRFVLNYFQENGTRNIILPSGLLYKPIFLEYNKRLGNIKNYEKNKIEKINKKINEKTFIQIIFYSLLYIINIFRSKINSIIKIYSLVLRYYFYPFWFSKKILNYNIFSKYMFLVNKTQDIIMTDPYEYKMVKEIFPDISNVFLAKQPSYNICKNELVNNGNLLVVVGGPIGYNLDSEKLSFWISTIETVSKLSSPNEIHLRFHPRETSSPIESFLNAIKVRNIIVKVIDSNQIPISDNFCSYIGVIGSPSGALRFARNASLSVFVIGLVDAIHEDFYNKPIALGDSSGILWIKKGDQISKESLVSSKGFINNSLSVGEILKQNFLS